MGPLAGGRHDNGTIFQVVSAAAKLIDENGKAWCAIVHEGLIDRNPAQRESLLSSAQVRHAGNALDDCHRGAKDTRGLPGTQCCKVGNETVPFIFDGAKSFYRLEHISEKEMKSLPRLVFTDDSKEYEPTDNRVLTRRLTPEELEWKRRLGFPPDKIVKLTLEATTQLIPRVEAESREIMRDHIKSRLPMLRLLRRNEADFLDTFKSSIKSIRGYQYFNLFAAEKSLYDDVHLMIRKGDSPATIKDHFLRVGAPHTLKSDNAKEFKSDKVKKTLREAYVSPKYTEPHHPNQNPAEARGGRLKHAIQHLLTVTQAPLVFWCYALEYLVWIRNRLAKPRLNNRSSFESITGGIPDISKCRYSFWQPIWFYTPKRSFPRQRMLPARFLGFSEECGDAFTYIIAVEPEEDGQMYQVFTRSVIRPRHLDEVEAPVVVQNDSTFKIFARDETTILQYEEDENDPMVYGPMAPPTEVASTNLDDFDEYAAALRAVYGPEAFERLRISESPGSNLLQTVDRPQQASTSSEEIAIPMDVDPTPPSAPQQESRIETTPTEEVAATGSPAPQVPERESVPMVTQPDDDEMSVESDSSDEEEDELVSPDSVDTHLNNLAGEDDDNDLFDSIIGHKFMKKKKEDLREELYLQVQWKTDSTSYEHWKDVREDYPYEAATYIRDTKIGTDRGTGYIGPYQRWSRAFLKKTNRVLRRFLRYSNVQRPMRSGSEFIIPEEDPSWSVHYTFDPKEKSVPRPRWTRRAKKPGRNRRQVPIKFGVRVPRSVQEALRFDKEDGTTHWEDAMKKEIAQLVALNCFDFHSPDFTPDNDSQEAKFTMIFEVKQDGRRKGRLVCNGHKIDPRGISTRSTVVKSISVRLLDVIAHRDGLKIIHGDVGNAFITANCLEKIHARAGPEFGDQEGCILTLNKALYGLRTSSRAYRETFAAFLRDLGFVASRYDRDVWMRLREEVDGYDYLCTHVDDFKIVARDPQRWVDAIAKTFTLKCAGDPDYYLGMDYHFDEKEQVWQTGTKTFVGECTKRIEALLPDGKLLCTHNTPSPSDDYQPELDQSEFLCRDGKRQYQMMIGMAQWAVNIGRMDISHAVSSLSRFSAAPRQGHLELAFHLFGYLKKFPNKQLIVDSAPLKILPSLFDPKDPKAKFDPDFLDDYPGAKEDHDPNEPDAYGKELETSIFFDANHAHDKKTRRSISGILIYVGSTLVQWHSKRQGCIASSTYTAEFMAMRTAVEEAIAIRYMLRSLGVPVEQPTKLFGDNMSVINNARVADSELKKKHVAISYHLVREAVAARIVLPIWCNTKENFADICTKSLDGPSFHAIVKRTML